MLNRKLTAADIGKEFICNEHGAISAVKLLYIDEDLTAGYPYCFTCLSIAQAHCFPTSHTWTDSKGNGAGSEVVSEIEEPEEFRLTGKEVWRASTVKDEMGFFRKYQLAYNRVELFGGTITEETVERYLVTYLTK